MASHNELGRWGEQIAEDYLKTKGFYIIARDWHSGHRDIDIIAKKDDIIKFVEVKTRSNNFFIEPEEAVNPQKIRNLRLAINHYLRYTQEDCEAQFDIIAITGTPQTEYTINHIEDISIY